MQIALVFVSKTGTRQAAQAIADVCKKDRPIYSGPPEAVPVAAPAAEQSFA